MINYLQSKGISVSRAGSEVRANCVYCEDTGGHLYLNPEKEVFYCHKCNEAGNIWKLKRHFGDILDISKGCKEKFKIPEQGLDIKYHEVMKICKEAVDYLSKERGFNPDAIKKFKLGYKDGYISFPYYLEGKLVNFKYRKITAKEFMREKDCESTIYNIDEVDKSQDIIITEGEADCIAAWQMGFTNVVSVSIGAGSFNDNWMDFFENCSGNIYIAYDNDPKGEEGAKKIANRIGIARCYRLKLPLKDFNDCLMAGFKKEDISLGDATNYKPSRIKHSIEAIAEFAERFKNGDKGKGLMLPDEWKGFNTMLGGIRPSEVTILTGDTCSGKTTLAVNWVFELLKMDKPVIMLSSEMPPHKIMGKLFSMHIGERLNDFNEGMLDKCIDYFSKKPLFFIDVHGHISCTELCECLDYARNKYGIEFALIDHLHFVIDRTKDNQVQAIELFMRDIVTISLKTDIHIMLIAHPSKLMNMNGVVDMNDLKGSSAIKQDAHNIIIVWRDRKQEDQGIHQIVIDAQKVRDEAGQSGHKKRYDFDMKSQRYKEAASDIGISKREVQTMPKRRIYGED